MVKIRHYFQQHPITHWLVTVTMTSVLMTIGGLLLHETNWPLLVVFAVGVPSAIFASRLIKP